MVADEPTLDDLRKVGEGWDFVYGEDIEPLTPAEFDRIATEQGYVKRPVCGECGGTGKAECECAHHVPGDTTNGCKLLSPCPSCGGTGFGRLVALDGIDVEKLRDALDTDIGVTNRHDAYGSPYAVADMIADDAWIVWEFARRVLAALDGGQEGDTQ